MGLEQNQSAEIVTVSANAIISKYKNKKDEYYFATKKIGGILKNQVLIVHIFYRYEQVKKNIYLVTLKLSINWAILEQENV